MKKRFLPLSMLLITMVLAQAGLVANAAEDGGKYSPRKASSPTFESYMKTVRANQETGLIDPAELLNGVNGTFSKDRDDLNWIDLGPDNYGSLTRAITYDKKDATGNTLLIGTMGGRIFKTTNGGITMQLAADLQAMINCMVQDEQGNTYVGTGDGRMSQDVNGLSTLGYENSFPGQGIFKSTDGQHYELMTSTTPTTDNGWGFVNELSIINGRLYAATNGGLRYSDDGAATWNTAVEGVATSVKTATDGTVLAVIDNQVYLSTNNANFTLVSNGEENMLPSDDVIKIIAVSPSDPNYMYVSYLTATYGTGNIYYTKDHGATWEVALYATNIYNIYDTRGFIDNYMIVYPNNPRKVLVGGIDLWTLEDSQNIGVYTPRCITLSSSHPLLSYLSTDVTRFTYIHSGVQTIVFNPENENVFYVGTEGGVFKGEYYESAYSFKSSNRYFITEEQHTSVARMMAVGISGLNNRVLGGSLDHGTISIYGEENVNNLTTGRAIFPNENTATTTFSMFGSFNPSFAGGPCAISTINPEYMFLTATGSVSAYGFPILRTETAGDDYNQNFYGSKGHPDNPNAFKTPFVLFENYNDTKTPQTVWYYAKEDLAAGDVVQVISDNGDYPFDYTLTEPLANGDSIEVRDVISASMIVAVEDTVFLARNVIKFDELTDWWRIGRINGIASAVALSTDGDEAYVGTVTGDLYRFTGLSDAITAGTACIDSTACVITFDTLQNMNSQAITSIAIDPRDKNNVIVTLGNYGNSNYVFYSSNGGDSFESIQGNLPLLPVYSSIIEKSTGKVMIGTENGIFTADGFNSNWTVCSTLANVPVMDLKQQTMENHDNRYTYLVDEMNDTTVIVHDGIFNEGMIYAATYGRGLLRCDNYHIDGIENSVAEIEDNTALAMSVYPNPVVENATISINLTEKSNVTYQIYDITGRMVANRTLGTFTQGSHQININVGNLVTGTYILKVQAGANSNSSKILVY